MTRLTELFVDTDLGVDDALALGVALKFSCVRLITTVAGNVPAPQATYNARVVLGVLGQSAKSSRPLLVEGHHTPLLRSPVFATDVHGNDGLGGVTQLRGHNGDLEFPPSDPEVADAFAPKEWLQLPRRQQDRRVLVALGPLTNLAAAILADRTLPEVFDEIVVLGGAVHGPGNVTAFAEFNVFADPEAAEIVFRAVPSLRVVPLEVCMRYVLREGFLRAVADRGSRIGRFMYLIHRQYMAWYREREGIDGCYPHDTFAIMAAIRPDAFKYQSVGLSVNCEKGHENYGQTFVNEHASNRLQLCVDVDTDAIANAVRETLENDN